MSEVFFVFLKLGVSCFGGPIAHLGYFRDEFVTRRRWLGEAAYADLVALAQFLPGPASSQTGFAIGLMRAGYGGGVAAWTGFTLPSAALMVLFAYAARDIGGTIWGAGLLHGLNLVAVAIVSQAVLGMARSLCPDPVRASIAVLALSLAALAPGPAGQLGAILLGAAAGFVFRHPAASRGDRLAAPISPNAGLLCLAAFFVLLGLTCLPATGPVALWDAFYRSGALVFGGGHVVLPLLRDAVVRPGWISEPSFVAGYGAAQAVPGPLFTFSAYLGATVSISPGGVLGGALALVAIFVPGMLVLLGALPFWDALRARPGAQAAMAGINAAVVGLLGAALYNPLWINSVGGPADLVVASAGFILLVAWQAPPLLVVLFSGATGVALASGL